VYELCLHYTNHSDHNVVNAALETLHQLLQSPPPDLLPILLSSQGVTRSHIQANEGQENLTQRSLSTCLILCQCFSPVFLHVVATFPFYILEVSGLPPSSRNWLLWLRFLL